MYIQCKTYIALFIPTFFIYNFKKQQEMVLAQPIKCCQHHDKILVISRHHDNLWQNYLMMALYAIRVPMKQEQLGIYDAIQLIPTDSYIIAVASSESIFGSFHLQFYFLPRLLLLLEQISFMFLHLNSFRRYQSKIQLHIHF